MKKQIVILGAGESGVGAAILAQNNGYNVFVSDNGKVKEKYEKMLCDYKIRWEEKKHTEDIILNAEEIIKSPGIPDNVEIIKQIKKKGIPIISEIEFAGRYTNAKIIGITGSNGKTTTTLLTYHILRKAGLKVGIAGNIGIIKYQEKQIGGSLAKQIAEEDYEYYVIELSSFQLDDMHDFKVNISIILNITPDHLDRYEYDLQQYINSKFRIIQNQDIKDVFIFCNDDIIITNELKKYKIQAQMFPFSIKNKIEEGAYLKNSNLTININKQLFTMSIYELALQGKHNILNSMAASIAARYLDIRKDVIRESLMDFQSIEHRLEFIAKIYGIGFINDSKATNVNSTWYALESMTSPVVWIVGGQDKGNDYSALIELVKEKVKAIICIGKDNRKIHKAFKKIIPNIVDVDSMQKAVLNAYRMGKKDDVVLLSPACASFDRFINYEDRGYQFKMAVKNL